MQPDTLASLRARGVDVQLRNGQVAARMLTGSMPDDVRLEVRARRDAIAAALVAEAWRPSHACGSCGRFHFDRPTVCFWCRGAAVAIGKAALAKGAA